MGNLGVEACNGKAEGDACQLTMRNQTVDGKCTNRQGNITCFPNNVSMAQRPNGTGGMGAQSIQACNGKATGDACQLTMRNQTVDGICADRGGNITCTPNNRNMGQRPGSPGGSPSGQGN